MGVSIGITSKIVPNKNLDNLKTDDCHYCYFYGVLKGCVDTKRSDDHHKSDRYGKNPGDGDKLSLVMDLKKAQISLAFDGNDQGIAFKAYQIQIICNIVFCQ